MNRRLLATLALLALIAGAGCLGGGPSDEALGENANYDWDTSANVSINISDGSFQAVHNITNQSRLDVYETDVLGSRTPLDIRSIQFQYRNGTVVNASAFNVSTNGERTRLGLPADEGKVAFTVENNNKEIILETFIDGSYAVTLPEGTDVGVPLLGKVDPGGYTKTTVDGRTQLQWENIESDTLVVGYYLDRDVYLFGGIFAIGLALAIGGSLYYYRQIKALVSQREQVDLDVEDD